MKIIVTHDVDHLTFSEHLTEFTLPKMLVRNHLELFLGKISGKELLKRYADLVANRAQHLDAIMDFDRKKNVPATFFFGVANGLGLSYGLESASTWIKRVLEKGFNVGVHGLSYDNCQTMRQEYETFLRLSGRRDFGIRMHYLRSNEKTWGYLSDLGYAFDSTLTMRMIGPFRVGSLWEFPINLADWKILCQNARWQSRDLQTAIKQTRDLMDASAERKLEFFTVLFHDFYFSDAYASWKGWFEFVIDYADSRNWEFVSFKQALDELKKHHETRLKQ